MTNVIGTTFCSLPEGLGGRNAAGGLRQWPVGHQITWTIVASLPGFSNQSMQEVVQSAFNKWAAVSGVQHKYIGNPRGANILVGIDDLGGHGGVLAQAELPWQISPNMVLRLWFDRQDSWTTATNWQNTGRFPLHTVCLHELGHNLGLGHDEDGRTDAIMDPQISHLSELQPKDIHQAVIRYGKVTPPPDNGGDDDDIPSGDDWIAKAIRCLQRLDKHLSAEDRKDIASLLN